MACTGKTDGTAQTAVQRRLATAAAQQTFQEASVLLLALEQKPLRKHNLQGRRKLHKA
jgi:hypothetical protein